MLAKDVGCSRDQIERFRQYGYCAQYKQLLFHSECRRCDDPEGPTEVGFGGARGPGKSHALIAQMLLDDCTRRDNLRCLLLRRVGKAVRESFEHLRLKVLPHLLHKYVRSDGVITLENGSRAVLGHFLNERDIDAYLGLEYDVIGVEEATTITIGKYKGIRTCCRTSRDDWRARMYSNANPGGIGHAYYKKRFRPNFKGARIGNEPRFVHATVEDNSFLGPDYRKILDELTGWKKRAWRYGDWDISAGQFFTTFQRDVHVVKAFDIPEWWNVWIAMDYGYAPTHWNIIYVLCEDPQGNIYVVDEIAHRKTLVPIIARDLEGALRRRKLLNSSQVIERFVVGGDAFQRRGSSGKSIADQWSVAGWTLEPANMDRIDGASEVLRRLGDARAGYTPQLYIFENCALLIECLPTMEHDPRRPDDVLKVSSNEDGVGGDDPYDALRYGIMVKAQVPVLESAVSPVPDWRS